MKMRTLLPVATLILSSASFASSRLTNAVLGALDEKEKQALRVTLSTPITAHYELTASDARVDSGDFVKETSTSLIKVNVPTDAKGKVVQIGYDYLMVSFSDSCTVPSCAYKFSIFGKDKKNYFTLSEVPTQQGYRLTELSAGYFGSSVLTARAQRHEIYRPVTTQTWDPYWRQYHTHSDSFSKKWQQLRSNLSTKRVYLKYNREEITHLNKQSEKLMGVSD